MLSDVYIGSLDDPALDEERLRSQPDRWNGNSPRSLAPFFPPGAQGNPFWAASSLGVESVQTDWGCTVYKATGAQIQDFFHRHYPDLPLWYQEHTAGYWVGHEGVANEMRRLEAFVATLDPLKKYALVAIEIA